MTRYAETKTPENDPENVVLSALAHGSPYLFIVASDVDDDPTGFKLRLATSLPDAATARRLLEKTLAAMP